MPATKPYKAIAGFVFAFLAVLYASIQGRPTLDGMQTLDWFVVVLGALVTAGATYVVPNPPTGA